MPIWYPDTCSCVFDVADDWQSAEVERTCERHANSETAFEEAKSDNVRKNKAVGILYDETDSPVDFKYEADGTLVVVLPPGLPKSITDRVKAEGGKSRLETDNRLTGKRQDV